MIYKSVNPDAITWCECGFSGEAREFGATGKVEDRHEKCRCPKCQSTMLEIEP